MNDELEGLTCTQLDELVAVELEGWKREKQYLLCPIGEAYTRCRFANRFSSDSRYAEKLLEKHVKRMGAQFQAWYEGGRWRVGIMRPLGFSPFVEHEIFGRAVCIALLRAGRAENTEGQ